MARILIVDDEPLNRRLLVAYFEGEGHELVEAASGEEALARAEEATPDLVLLDVMMPGLDGFEVARRLKARFAGTIVPVVLVTALDDRGARVAGLAAGADEFLTKPVDREELLLRARNLLALRAHEVELARRADELAELHRFRDELMAMLVHDLKSPLAVMLSSVEFAAEQVAEGELREALDDAAQAGARIGRLIGNLLDTAQAEAGELVVRRGRVALAPLAGAVLGPRRAALERRGIAVEVDDAGLAVDGDRDLLARVLENLVEHAARAVTAPGRVRVWAAADGAEIAVRVGHTGAPIPAPLRARLFEKWGAREARGGIGLGLYFCRLAVEAHGGRIWAEDTPELPVVIGFSLAPAALHPGAGG